MGDFKTRRILLTSASRTANATSVVQKDSSQQYARAYLNVTTAGASLKVLFRGYADQKLAPAALNAGGAGVIAAGIYVFELGPGDAAAAGDVKETVGRLLPCIWDVRVVHADATPATYSLIVEVFPPG